MKITIWELLFDLVKITVWLGKTFFRVRIKVRRFYKAKPNKGQRKAFRWCVSISYNNIFLGILRNLSHFLCIIKKYVSEFENPTKDCCQHKMNPLRPGKMLILKNESLSWIFKFQFWLTFLNRFIFKKLIFWIPKFINHHQKSGIKINLEYILRFLSTLSNSIHVRSCSNFINHLNPQFLLAIFLLICTLSLLMTLKIMQDIS